LHYSPAVGVIYFSFHSQLFFGLWDIRVSLFAPGFDSGLAKALVIGKIRYVLSRRGRAREAATLALLPHTAIAILCDPACGPGNIRRIFRYAALRLDELSTVISALTAGWIQKKRHRKHLL